MGRTATASPTGATPSPRWAHGSTSERCDCGAPPTAGPTSGPTEGSPARREKGMEEKERETTTTSTSGRMRSATTPMTTCLTTPCPGGRQGDVDYESGLASC